MYLINFISELKFIKKISIFRLFENILSVEGAAEADVGGDLGKEAGAVHLVAGHLAGLDQGLLGQGGLGGAGEAGVPQQPEQLGVDGCGCEVSKILSGYILLVVNFFLLLCTSVWIQEDVDKWRSIKNRMGLVKTVNFVHNILYTRRDRILC